MTETLARLLHAPPTVPAGQPHRARVISICMRLLLLVAAGLVVQIGWIVIWTLSYRLTHGNHFTYEYLVNQPLVWEKLRDLQVLINTLVPGVEVLDAGPVHTDILYFTMVGGFVLTGVGYLAAIALLDLGVAAVRGAMAMVLAFTALFQATLFLLPGLFTTDIFSYLMYGHISAVFELNPYIYPPNYFPNHELLKDGWIHPIWHDQPSVYGPLWTGIGWLMAQLFLRFNVSLVDSVWAYKILLNVIQVLNLVLVWWLLRRLLPTSPRARLTAFLVFAWNPLMQFDTAGNAHNDGLMVTLLLLAVVPLALHTRITNLRWSIASVFLALSALIKYTTVLVGLLYVVAWVRRMPSWSQRLAWIGGTGIAVSAITVILFLPWLDFPRSLEPIVKAADGKSWQFSNSAPDVIAMHIDNKLLNPPSADPAAENHVYFYGDVYWTPTTDSTRGWLKVITRAIFVVYLAWECWALWRLAGDRSRSIVEPILRASVRVFTVLILLVFPWVLEWYWMWPMALAALLGWRDMHTKVVVAYTVLALPLFYTHHYWNWHTPSWVVLLYAFPPLAMPLIAWLVKRFAAAAPQLKPALMPTAMRIE